MMLFANRRSVLLGLAAMAASPARAADRDDRVKSANDRLAAIEARAGGRLGVAVLDSGGGPGLAHRAGERFPMCSTFKLLASAAVLKRVDEGKERLDRIIAYGPGDLLEYAPVTKSHLASGGMTLGDLCAAAIDWSDNTAANLILDAIGGPSGWTAFVRSLGDGVSRLDRNEPTLNTAVPGDERDTTSPLAMARDLKKALLGDVLSEASRAQLEAWLSPTRSATSGCGPASRQSWGIGDKTGTGDHGTANTIAILRPPGRAPLIAAVYYTEADSPMEARNAVHKQIGGIIAETFAAA